MIFFCVHLPCSHCPQSPNPQSRLEQTEQALCKTPFRVLPSLLSLWSRGFSLSYFVIKGENKPHSYRAAATPYVLLQCLYSAYSTQMGLMRRELWEIDMCSCDYEGLCKYVPAMRVTHSVNTTEMFLIFECVLITSCMGNVFMNIEKIFRVFLLFQIVLFLFLIPHISDWYRSVLFGRPRCY